MWCMHASLSSFVQGVCEQPTHGSSLVKLVDKFKRTKMALPNLIRIVFGCVDQKFKRT